jgi:hypothetical protein
MADRAHLGIGRGDHDLAEVAHGEVQGKQSRGVNAVVITEKDTHVPNMPGLSNRINRKEVDGCLDGFRPACQDPFLRGKKEKREIVVGLSLDGARLPGTTVFVIAQIERR